MIMSESACEDKGECECERKSERECKVTKKFS